MSDIEPLQLRFDAFELDEGQARLTRGGRPIALAPKAFAVLCTLARQPGQLVLKNALLDAVWGHQHVSESVLKTTISELRAALSDDAKQPRYIETAARRGYRFIGGPSALPADTAARASAAPIHPAHVQLQIIGRADARTRLHAAWKLASEGRRQIFWIAGEAGVGKSTLIDSFVSDVAPITCARGQCVEQFGAGEPYLPVLEALGELSRNDGSLKSMMRAIAPTWLLQLPWLSSEAEREALRREVAGSGTDRMLRELAELLDQYTSRKPVLLITEDLHWSDHATVRLIDYVARRRNSARLMWLASFRVAELVLENHPLRGLRHELRMHRLCDEIVLDPFSEQELADYIGDRFPDREFSEAFVRLLHAHTDGLPLFVVNVIDDLISQGILLPDRAELSVGGPTPWQVPENLAGVMEKQIARLPPDVRPVLEAASVCGMEFQTQTIADALGHDALWVGERCDELVRQQHWIGHVDLGGLADGSLGARYAFRHALYRHVFYQRIGAVTRAQLHRAVALSMERGRATGVAVAAAELASHYDLGHDPMAALRHYADAADAALKQFAQVEAVSLTGQALALLPRCPQEPPRFALELALMLKRGVACSQLHGMSSKEAHAAFERAQALCDLLPETPALGWALNGLALVRFGAADYDAAHALGVRIHALADRHNDPELRIAASNLMGLSCACHGEHAKAIEWLELGVSVCEALPEPPSHDRFFVDPGVSMGGHLGVHLPPLGLVDRARAHAERALARARRLAHPMAEGVATRCFCMLEIRLNNPERAASMAQRLAQLAADHGIIQADGAARLLGGWAQAHLGDPAGGYARILEGGAILEQIGMRAGATQVACYAAEALLASGRWSDAMRHVDEGLQLARRLGERSRVPDFLLLRGRAELGHGQVDAARASMRESLSEARAQQAPGFELAALVALCEIEEPAADDLSALERAHAQIVEGFDTKLMRRARDLVERRRRGQRTT